MIKDLIRDIAFDNIQLSQALTRAKLIAFKIKDDTFKKWLSKELEGYELYDELLPSYRKIGGTIYFKAEFPFGKWQTFPIEWDAYGNLNARAMDILKFHRVTPPIATIEHMLEPFDKQPTALIPFDPDIVEVVTRPYEVSVTQQRGVIRSAHREIARAQMLEIIVLTKQKLLDILMQLDEQFPNLENEFKETPENAALANNIVTTNIYGNDNPVNIAAGHSVSQSNVIHVIKDNDANALLKLGVSKELLEEVKAIQTQSANEGDMSAYGKKIMKWFGNVATSVTAKGLADKIPAIWEHIQHWIK